MSRLNADIALFAAAGIWGVAFLFQKSAMAHVGPLAFIAARSLVAALALAPLALREHRQVTAPAGEGFPLIAIGGGLAFFVAAWLQQEGIRTATVTNASFLTALYVVLTPFVAWGWSGKVPNPIVWPAVALSALGTWLLGGGSVGAFSRGDLLVAFSAFFWAVHVVVTGRASVFGRPIGFTAMQFAAVAVLAATRCRRLREHDPRGPRRSGRRHCLPRAALERALLHHPDAGAAAHAALGGRGDRKHGNRVRRARRLPGAG